MVSHIYTPTSELHVTLPQNSSSVGGFIHLPSVREMVTITERAWFSSFLPLFFPGQTNSSQCTQCIQSEIPFFFFSVFLVSVWGYEVRGTWRPIFVWYASWRDLDPIKIDQKFNSDIEHSLCLKMLVEKKEYFGE